MRTRIKPSDEFVAYKWGPGAYRVTERVGFKTLTGAERYAERNVALDGVLGVSVRKVDNDELVARYTPSK